MRGDLLLSVETEFPDRLNELDYLYLGPRRRRFGVLSARRHGRDLLLTLAGIADRAQAEPLRGMQVFIRAGDAAPLPPGRYYFHEVEGLEVVTDADERLGRVMQIMQTGANHVYVVRNEAGAEILLPAIPSVVLKYDLEAGRLLVHLLEGLR
jgi:16S rRNA processing protein RimM